MECRPGCAACCVVISISSPLPGMPHGKPAGVRCIHLTENRLCALFGDPARPTVCVEFTPTPELCGTSNEEARASLAALEAATGPNAP